MTRPFDMTEEERESLPVGPIQNVFVPYTMDDIKNGAIGCGRMSPIRRGVLASYYEPNDPISWVDRDGYSWTFGQYSDDKTWFKEPSLF